MLMRHNEAMVAITAIALSTVTCAQDDEEKYSSATFDGLKLRSIGPAFMSGRIADVALHPEDPNTWYVGVGSSGMWKTSNAGTTWTPGFDDQDT
jgi:hypothetical protein